MQRSNPRLWSAPTDGQQIEELNLIVALLIEQFAIIHGRRPKSKKELGIRRDDHPPLVVLRLFATSYTGCSSFRSVSHVSTIARSTIVGHRATGGHGVSGEQHSRRYISLLREFHSRLATNWSRREAHGASGVPFTACHTQYQVGYHYPRSDRSRSSLLLASHHADSVSELAGA